MTISLTSPPQTRHEYDQLYQASLRQPTEFWDAIAQQTTTWFSPYQQVHQGELGGPGKWFVGGTTNLSYDALDRHIEQGRGNETALIWLDENGKQKTITFSELLAETCRVANGLQSLGVQKGDRVVIYMPLSIEHVAAMLACARMGAVHVVVFAGFSAQALRSRVLDTGARVILTASHTQRRGKIIPLVDVVRESSAELARDQRPTVVVWNRTENALHSELDWYETFSKQAPTCPALHLESEDPLFILHTSGTTGAPKGLVHTQGGYSVYTQLTCRWVLDIHPGDRYWCTADTGWITGHSYVVYGPLMVGATVIIAEGAVDYPSLDRWWQIIQDLRVSIFYTAPTALRLLRQAGGEPPTKRFDLSSLRILASVGEPLNPDVRAWFSQAIGNTRCPVIDTWWQTETGGHLLATLPSLPQKPGYAGLPFFGIEPAILDDSHHELGAKTTGMLVIKQPWPSCARTCWNNPTRYAEYWSSYVPYFATGDLAQVDSDGTYQVLGRADDVINMAGHRLGTAEVENVLITHPAVAESAAVSVPNELKGEGLHVYITLRPGKVASNDLQQELREHVKQGIGRFVTLDRIEFVPNLPKTRSGKIMRRLLRAQTRGEDVGDTSTQEN